MLRFLVWAVLLVVPLLGCSRTSSVGVDAFDHRTVSPDGLIAVKYPADFEVKSTTGPNGSSVVVESKGPTDGMITFVTKPGITTLDSLVEQLHTPGPDESGETRAPATCAGKPGMEIRSTWTVQGFPFVKRRCFVIAGDHGVLSTYTVMKQAGTAREARLKAIGESVEFLK